MNILDSCCFNFSKQSHKLIATLYTEVNNLIALTIITMTELGRRVHVCRFSNWHIAIGSIHIHKVKVLTTICLIVCTKVNVDFLYIIQGSKISASFVPVIIISPQSIQVSCRTNIYIGWILQSNVCRISIPFVLIHINVRIYRCFCKMWAIEEGNTILYRTSTNYWRCSHTCTGFWKAVVNHKSIVEIIYIRTFCTLQTIWQLVQIHTVCYKIVRWCHSVIILSLFRIAIENKSPLLAQTHCFFFIIGTIDIHHIQGNSRMFRIRCSY